MNCEEDLLKYFKNAKLNYHFDDDISYGKRQPITGYIDYSNKMKELKYGDLLDDEMINKLAVGLPTNVTLSQFIETVYDQKDKDIGVSCCIAAAITIRTNYINYQRYRITKWIFGNKLPLMNPSVLYINWNANIQNIQKYKDNNVEYSGISPSIYSHLLSLESHKVVDVSKYDDNIEKLDSEPNLISFYYASKSKDFIWYKIKQNETFLKVLLNDGYPIICSIIIYKEMLNLVAYQFGIIETPNTEIGLPCGSQPIVIIGYDEKKKIFYFLCSFNYKWGNNGIGQLSYDYLLNSNLAGDFAILDYKF